MVNNASNTRSCKLCSRNQGAGGCSGPRREAAWSPHIGPPPHTSIFLC